MHDKRVRLVIVLQVLTAFIFIAGSRVAHQSMQILYQSYFADIAIPFAFYFLLSLVEYRHGVLQAWWAKALVVFGLCAASEILQFFGIFALARVFDPIDFVMYGLGVLLAVIVDRVALTKIFSFWV